MLLSIEICLRTITNRTVRAVLIVHNNIISKMSELDSNSLQKSFDFSKICRVCCSSRGVMVSIFRVHISRKIMALSAVQVWESDGLPGQICNECIVKLDISFQFKKQCEKADQNFRQYKAMLEASKTIVRKRIRKERYFDNIPTINPPDLSEHIECTPDMSGQTATRNNDVLADELPLRNSVLTDLSHAVPSSLKSHSDLLSFTYEEMECLEDLKPDPEGYQCKTCYKVFSTATKLSRHAYVHSGQKPFQCDICKKAFSHNSNLKAHKKMHSSERPYVCGVCQKGCKRAKDLEMHMRTHTGEKPHACSACGRAFSSSSNLIAHQRTHTGEKPYVCSVCQKSFCQSNELSKHKKIHVKEKHVCEICNKAFTGSSALIVHVMNHNEERSNVCSICYKSFESSDLLAVHLEKHEMGQLDF